MTAPFPWDQAMQFGLGVLRLSPDAFWRMTPRELAQAMAASRGQGTPPPPLPRGALDALLRQFPDEEHADE